MYHFRMLPDNPHHMTGGDETVHCYVGPEGITIWTSRNEDVRQFSLPWSWVHAVRNAAEEASRKASLEEIPVVERPQAELGLRGYLR